MWIKLQTNNRQSNNSATQQIKLTQSIAGCNCTNIQWQILKYKRTKTNRDPNCCLWPGLTSIADCKLCAPWESLFAPRFATLRFQTIISRRSLYMQVVGLIAGSNINYFQPRSRLKLVGQVLIGELTFKLESQNSWERRVNLVGAVR